MKKIFVFLALLSISIAFPPIRAGVCDDVSAPRRHITPLEARELISKTLKTVEQARKDLDMGEKTGDRDGIREFVEAPIYGLMKEWRQFDIRDDEGKKRFGSNHFIYCMALLDDINGLAFSVQRPDGIAARKSIAAGKARYETDLHDCTNYASELGIE